MPRSTLVKGYDVPIEGFSQPANDQNGCCPVRLNCNDDPDWDAFTLSTGLIFLALGLVCCLIQIISILCEYSLNCYGVGLWCATAFLIPGVLAMKLYINDRVAPVSWMIASVICDLLFGIIVPMVGARFASQCVHQWTIFVSVALACAIGILTGAIHAGLFIREIARLHRQRKCRPLRSDGFLPAVAAVHSRSR